MFKSFCENIAKERPNNEMGMFDEDFKMEVEVKLEARDKCSYYQEELDKPFTKKEVFQAIRELNMGTAGDESGMVPDVIKSAADAVRTSKFNSVMDAITVLCNYIFETETWPTRWSSGTVIPIHKGRSVMDPGNYRPISLLPILSKIFSVLLTKRVMQWSEERACWRRNREDSETIKYWLYAKLLWTVRIWGYRLF